MAETTGTPRNIFTLLQLFLRDSRATGIVLLVCTICSMVIANTSAGSGYLQFIGMSIHFPSWLHLPHSLLHWINDGAMALFFFLVGMEIKRELLQGELSSIKKATLPVAAALGGMLVPALIYLLFNYGNDHAHGWGIPMATDIAFSLGIMSILGARVPVTLKIFLMALAIIDDLGAIIVIALFYGEKVDSTWLLISGAIVIVMAIFYRLKWLRLFVFVILSVALWYAVFNSGIHPTIAGVTAAMFVPTDRLSNYEHKLHGIVNFIVLPLFALANTAIILPGNVGESLTDVVSIGIIAGLVIGKPVGIVLFSWLAVQSKLGIKPSGAGWMQMTGVGALAGIGFTMSIFISMLAFDKAASVDMAKLAVLTASLLAAIAGIILLRMSAAKNV